MNIPKGYIYKDKSKSVEEAVSSASNDRAKSLTKMAVKNYIANFFNSDGAKRELLQGFSSQSLQYITDKSYEESGKDSTQRYMQLAVFFEELKERVPFIVIADNGFDIVKSGVGIGLSGAQLVQNNTRITIPILRKVHLNIIVGTKDVESTDILSTAISILFNEVRFLGGGDRISGNYQNGDIWEVRLPHEPINQSVSSRESIGDDPLDSIWWTETSLPVWFEDIIQLESDHIHWTLDEPVADKTLDDLVQIDFPSTIRCNQQYNLVVTGHDGTIAINIDNPQIANYDPQSKLITPRRLGNFVIRVMRGCGQGSAENGLLAEKAVEVVF